MKVLKFGGSSLADGPRIGSMAEVVAAVAAQERIAIILSAMQGVTDLLITAARKAEAGSEGGRIVLEQIRERHLAAVRHLFAAPDQSAVIAPLTFMLNDLEEILHGIELIRECSPRTLDLVMSFGERLSCALAVAHLRVRGVAAEFMDARELILTDENFGAAAVDFPASYARIRNRFAALNGAAVIPGFIAATASGVTTTLGRNGSDYTASIVGAGTAAEVIEIWTDVDGVLSADPRLVPEAFVVPEISYEEAMELSYFGAKVLHPYTMLPAVEKGIPIRIRNSLNPAAPGTLIGAPHHLNGLRGAPDGANSHPITGIASIEGISLVNIEGGGMIGIPGIAARVFSALARERINIIMISQASSEHTISLVLRSGEAARALAALEAELAMELSTRRIQALELIGDLLIVSVIGEKMRGKPGLAGRLFTALGEAGVNILAIAQGSAERNISIVIEARDQALALRAIHAAFLGDLARPRPGTAAEGEPLTIGRS
jgi:aspartokinase/homoserine dehydrogenase 1